MNKLMKNKSLIFVIMLFFTLSACDKNNDGGGNANDIVGEWTITSSDMSITINGIDFIQYLMDEMGLTQTEAQGFEDMYITDMTGTVEIKSDGTYTSNMDGEIDNGTWDLNTSKTKLTFDKGTVDEMTMDVNTLTSSKLVISFDETDNTSDMNGDEINDTLVAKIKLTLTK